MIAYYFKRLMWWLGYRHVFYMPSRHGIKCADFWSWHYAPHSPKRDYTEKHLPLPGREAGLT